MPSDLKIVFELILKLTDLICWLNNSTLPCGCLLLSSRVELFAVLVSDLEKKKEQEMSIEAEARRVASGVETNYLLVRPTCRVHTGGLRRNRRPSLCGSIDRLGACRLCSASRSRRPCECSTRQSRSRTASSCCGPGP